jgi:hypothetical protein
MKHVAGRVFRNFRLLDSASDRFLNDRFTDVVAPLDTGLLIEVPTACCKDELPSPLRIRIAILVVQRVRQGGASRAFDQIFLVGALHIPELREQILFRRRREHRYPILAAFSAPNSDFHCFKVDILHAQGQTFQ